MDDLLNELRNAVIEGDADRAVAITGRCLEQGISAHEIFERAIVMGIQDAGVLWDCDRYRVPDVILSADAFNSAVSVIEERLRPGGADPRPKVLLGVVEGDVHDLGKNIVSAMMQGAGLHIIDLGVDVSPAGFVEAVERERPDIVGIGAYMSTSMLTIPEIIDALNQAGLRSRIKVLVGGVVVTQQFATETGADGWALDATSAVRKAKELLGQER